MSTGTLSVGRPPSLPARTGRRATATWAAVALAGGVAVGGAAAVSPSAGALVAGGILAVSALALGAVVGASLLIVQLYFEALLPGWLVVVAALICLAEIATGRRRFRAGAPWAWTCVYATWAFASLLWTVDVGRTLSVLGSLVIAMAFLLIMAVVVSSRTDLHIVLWTVAASSAGTAAYGFGEIALGSTERLAGAAVDANLLALYQVAALPLTVFLLARARRRRTATILALLAGLTTASVLASVSRGGLLALAVVLVLLAAAGSVYRSPRHRRLAVAVVLLFVVSAAVPVTTSLQQRSDTEEIAAASGRVNQWLAGGTAVRDSPLLGIGYGGFLVAGEDLLRETPGVDLEGFQLRGQKVSVHNAYLGTLTDLGIVGFALFLAVVLSTLVTLRRTARRALRAGDGYVAGAATALLIGLAGWCVASVFISSELAFPFWAFVGLALAARKLTEGDREGAPGTADDG